MTDQLAPLFRTCEAPGLNLCLDTGYRDWVSSTVQANTGIVP
jgi:hypothetical protein